ncbi:MAG: tetratricopeptide repeat protein [Caulobacteraceae bacterium]
MNASQYADQLRRLRPEAEKGDTDAEFAIGIMYYVGLGVPGDKLKALEWWRRAADLGNSHAQAIIGLRFSFGIGAVEDYGRAFRWFQRSANEGNEFSKYYLAIMLKNGESCSRDLMKALMWLELALPDFNDAAFPPESLPNREEVKNQISIVKSKITPAQIHGVDKMVSAWTPICATGDSPPAPQYNMMNCGYSYFNQQPGTHPHVIVDPGWMILTRPAPPRTAPAPSQPGRR